MSIPENKEFKKIQFYLTANYNCGYLPEKKAQSIVASPYQNVNQNVNQPVIMLTKMLISF